MESKNQMCQNCRFFYDWEILTGKEDSAANSLCNKRSPTTALSRSPFTDKYQWCGEWEEGTHPVMLRLKESKK